MSFDKITLQDICEMFIGDKNDDIKSTLVLQTSVINTKKEETILSIYASDIAKTNIKFIENKVILDLYFSDSSCSDYINLITNMDIYKLLLKETKELIINKITLVLNDEYKTKQMLFLNPIYFTKSANKAGGKINGIRLFYDIENIIYIPNVVSDEMIAEWDKLDEIDDSEVDFNEN